jgi:hypothetical protein
LSGQVNSTTNGKQERLTEWDQVGFVAAGAMQKEQSARGAARQKRVQEVECRKLFHTVVTVRSTTFGEFPQSADALVPSMVGGTGEYRVHRLLRLW